MDDGQWTVFHPLSPVKTELHTMYKFERLEVWQLALDYVDHMYDVAGYLPKSEDFNLNSQLRRAATSIALNIAEGSTGQSDAEQARFLGMAIRSLLETVACLQLIRRRGYLADSATFDRSYTASQTLARKLHAMRRAVQKGAKQAREELGEYLVGWTEDGGPGTEDALDDAASVYRPPSTISPPPSSTVSHHSSPDNEISFHRPRSTVHQP